MRRSIPTRVHDSNPVCFAAILVDTLKHMLVLLLVVQEVCAALHERHGSDDTFLDKGLQQQLNAVVHARFNLVVVIDDDVAEALQEAADYELAQVNIIAHDCAYHAAVLVVMG